MLSYVHLHARHQCVGDGTGSLETTNDSRYSLFPLKKPATWEIGLRAPSRNLLVEDILSSETGGHFKMAKHEPPSVSRDLEVLRRKLCLLLDSFQSNAKVSLQRRIYWEVNTGLNKTECCIFLITPCCVWAVAIFFVAAKGSAIILTFEATGQQGSGRTIVFKLPPNGVTELQNPSSYIPYDAEFGWIVTHHGNCHPSAGSKEATLSPHDRHYSFLWKLWLICSPKKGTSKQLVSDLSSVFH